MEQTDTTPEAATRSVRIGVAVTPEEALALKKLVALYPERFDGVASVLHEYSVREAVRLSDDRERRLESIGLG